MFVLVLTLCNGKMVINILEKSTSVFIVEGSIFFEMLAPTFQVHCANQENHRLSDQTVSFSFWVCYVLMLSVAKMLVSVGDRRMCKYKAWMQRYWRGKRKSSGKNLSHSSFFPPQIWCGLAWNWTWPLWLEAGDWLPEVWHGSIYSQQCVVSSNNSISSISHCAWDFCMLHVGIKLQLELSEVLILYLNL